MNDGQFTLKAAVLWGSIPKEGRLRILANVFCPRCRDSATMSSYKGEERNGDVILKGACAKCGHEVVRVVETSERDSSVN
jgi:Zn ribbon nucleic-acid-binding protein